MAALNEAGDDDKKREEAERTIQENPLPVEVRTGWPIAGSFTLLKAKPETGGAGAPGRGVMHLLMMGKSWKARSKQNGKIRRQKFSLFANASC